MSQSAFEFETDKPPSNAEAKARAYAAQLEREGWPADVAIQRARTAYCLDRERYAEAPDLPDEYKAALLAASAAKRVDNTVHNSDPEA